MNFACLWIIQTNYGSDGVEEYVRNEDGMKMGFDTKANADKYAREHSMKDWISIFV